MRIPFVSLFVSLALLPGVLPAQTPGEPFERRKTELQPMRYLVSRPTGWKAGQSYPVVVVIPDAERDFAKTMLAYMAARGKRPYVIVVPEVLTAGPSVRGQKERAKYDYDPALRSAVWNRLDCDFDNSGMAALQLDIKRLDSPAGPFYLTGWEAGGHVLWFQYFKHPDHWAGLAAVATNYIGRCLQDRRFAPPQPDGGPPARFFYGTGDKPAAPGGVLYDQWIVAQRVAKRQGLTHTSEVALPTSTHGPLPEAVLAWFDSLRTTGH